MAYNSQEEKDRDVKNLLGTIRERAAELARQPNSANKTKESNGKGNG